MSDSKPHSELVEQLRSYIYAGPDQRPARSVPLAALDSLQEQLEALEVVMRGIERFAYDHHDRHTGFTHIQRMAMAALSTSNPASEPKTS